MVPPLGRAPAPLALIAAVARNGVIGAGNRLPWRLPEDLRHFRTTTVGHSVIMGRRTWESLRGALAERQNIVVTHRSDYQAAGADVVHNLDAALAAVARPAPAYCIGGGELYREALPRATMLCLTEIDRDYAGDTTFPQFDRGQWREVAREAHETADGVPYAFVTYERLTAGG